MNFEDALKFAPESLGFEAISGNDIVDVKQVKLLTFFIFFIFRLKLY